MKKIAIVSLLALALSGALFGQDSPVISSKDIMHHIGVLAADSLEGRAPGTPGDKMAAEYILARFENAGLEMLYDNGLQRFNLLSSVTPGESCSFGMNEAQYVMDKDFAPALFSGNGTLSGEVAFCGYGFRIDEDELKWNDFEGLDLDGKWAMILRGDPEVDSAMSAFIPYSGDRTKVFNAIDEGAAGVILVTPAMLEESDKLPKQYFDRSGASAAVPVLYINRKTAAQFLDGKDVNKLAAMLNENRSPASFNTGFEAEANIEIEKKSAETYNVVAMLPGTDEKLKEEYILIGAHYDHLGWGGPGSGSRVPDTSAIHNGADDNASGVAGVIELAQYFAAGKASHPRSIIFAAFGAEESGLVGSKYLSGNMPVPVEQVKAMFNFDMIGRYNKDKGVISVGGTGTALESDSLIDLAAKDYPFGVAKSPDGYGPSDHASFYSKGVPVFFISTGAHRDYHTPLDDIEFIDGNMAERVASFSAELVSLVAAMEAPLTFQRTSSENTGARRSMRLKVTFGIMPDMVSQTTDGLGVDGVRPGGPADKAGMKTGDRIVAINGEKVTDIYNYMHRLGKLEPGETAVVEVIRDGESEILLIQL
ncbi:MAG: hypothetical protein C0593_03725 [Marinilabiliales bacterium]|nr:MAG: hypothetical protein C0593_03725 [Marinilabiliales bacterium]